MPDPFEDLPKPKPRTHVVGEDLSALSVAELEDRIAQLQTEIVRLEDARDRKLASRSAADGFFKL